MRFKNLTITLTLTGLSIVALVALTLLSITEGICDWNGGESNKWYYTNSVHIDKQAHPNNPDAWSEDTKKGRGWHLSANLSASGWGSSAYVSPSIYGTDPLLAYTEETTYSGTANVRAWRVNTGMSILCDTCGSYYSYEVDAAEDKNTDIGDSQTIAAKIEYIRYYELQGIELDTSTGHQISTGLKASTDVQVAVVNTEVEVWSEYTWTHESGKTLKAHKKREYSKLERGGTQDQYASISNFGAAQVQQHGLISNGQDKNYPANSHAETNFYFEGVFSSNSVSYWYNPSDSSLSTSGSYYYFW